MVSAIAHDDASYPNVQPRRALAVIRTLSVTVWSPSSFLIREAARDARMTRSSGRRNGRVCRVAVKCQHLACKTAPNMSRAP